MKDIEERIDTYNKHWLWVVGLCFIALTICVTFIYLQNHAWIIRFEMDNNTLEAIKSINWSAIPTPK